MKLQFSSLHHFLLVSVFSSATLLGSGSVQSQQTSPPVSKSDVASVSDHYIAMAHCRYLDSLAAARMLLNSTQEFLKSPTEETHDKIKNSWIRAHCVYSNAEVFRFGNPNVDAWESKVNAWPMDEGLIDYVSENYIFHEGNPHANRNIIQKGTLPITDELIAEYHSGADPKAAPITSITDIESNVTIGFHAVEFLLWGQDLSTEPNESGKRSYTDYLIGKGSTNGHNQRRRNYLTAAVRCICADLQQMVIDWDPKGKFYSRTFRKLEPSVRLDRMLLGMGSLGYAELAIERMRVSLLTSNQEEEQSCFSDTTLLSIHHNAVSVETLYLGTYRRIDGSTFAGPSISELVARVDSGLDLEMKGEFKKTRELTQGLLKEYEQGNYFDWMIREDNKAGRMRIKQLILQLRKQAIVLEKIQKITGKLAKQE